MESRTGAQAADSRVVGLVRGLMWVSLQVPGQEMLPFWCLVLLGGLLPPSQGLVSLGSVLGLSPVQPKDGELGGFPHFPGERRGTGGCMPTSVLVCPVPHRAHGASPCSSGTCLLAGLALWGTQLCSSVLRGPCETSRAGQPHVGEPTFLVNEICPMVEV